MTGNRNMEPLELLERLEQGCMMNLEPMNFKTARAKRS
jgi:hypothetical protein